MKLFNSVVWFSEAHKIVVINITYILIYLFICFYNLLCRDKIYKEICKNIYKYIC